MARFAARPWRARLSFSASMAAFSAWLFDKEGSDSAPGSRLTSTSTAIDSPSPGGTYRNRRARDAAAAFNQAAGQAGPSTEQVDPVDSDEEGSGQGPGPTLAVRASFMKSPGTDERKTKTPKDLR